MWCIIFVMHAIKSELYIFFEGNAKSLETAKNNSVFIPNITSWVFVAECQTGNINFTRKSQYTQRCFGNLWCCLTSYITYTMKKLSNAEKANTFNRTTKFLKTYCFVAGTCADCRRSRMLHNFAIHTKYADYRDTNALNLGMAERKGNGDGV